MNILESGVTVKHVSDERASANCQDLLFSFALVLKSLRPVSDMIAVVDER